jgi:hypothetical protein
VRIKGENRLTLDLQYQTGDAITEAKRGVVSARCAGGQSGGPHFGAGRWGHPAFGAILCGRAQRWAQPFGFAAGAVADETSAWRTLTPASQQLTINSALARALAAGATCRSMSNTTGWRRRKCWVRRLEKSIFP